MSNIEEKIEEETSHIGRVIKKKLCENLVKCYTTYFFYTKMNYGTLSRTGKKN